MQAVLGATLKVDTIHGKVDLKIPAGTQNGTEFTLKGSGAPSVRTDRLGDHFVKIYIDIPTKLSKSEKDLYMQLANDSKTEVNDSGWLF